MVNVLIFAEDLPTQQALSAAVAAEGGYPVVAASYQTALTELVRSEFPLILAPPMLVNTSGSQLCAALRATPGATAASIIAYLSSPHDVPSTLAQDGFDGLLRAPFDEQALNLHIHAAARRLGQLDELRAVRARSDAFRRLALDLAWSTTVEQQARHALETALKLSPATRGAIWLRDHEQERLRCLHMARLSERYPRAAAALLAFTSRDQWLELTRGPLVAEQLHTQPDKLGDLARDEGFDTAITVALFTPAAIVGALQLYCDEGVQPSGVELQLAETVAAVTAMAFDQSQRQAELHAAHHTYRELIEQLPDGVVTLDERGNLLSANAAMQAICGYDADQLLLMEIYDLLEGGHEGEPGGLLAGELARLSNSEEDATQLRGPFEMRLLHGERRIIDVELRLRTVEQHDIRRLQVLVRDVSAERHVARRLATTRRIAEMLAGERDMRLAVPRVLGELANEHAWVALWTHDHPFDEKPLAEVTQLEVRTADALRRRAVEHAPSTREPRLLAASAGQPALAVAPIRAGSEPLGWLAAGLAQRDASAADDLEMLTSVGTQLAPALERWRLRRELDERAAIDPTTGLENRGTFHQQLELAIAASGAEPVSLLVVGVDEFKQINDLYGHTVGDTLLRQLGQLIDAQLSPPQRVARFTSDEFAVILPATSRADVFGLAEQLRISIGMKLFTAAEQVEQLTVSVGIATYPEDAGNADRLVLAAGHALFLAKQAGRNQVYQSNEAFAELASAHGRIIDLLRQAPKETLTLLVRAMDQRLPERAGHAQRVAAVAVELGQELGLDSDRLSALRIAALAHDIGMFALPDALLRKPSRLSPAEREQVSNTPLVAHRLLSQIELPPTVLPAVVHQQERWDGSGFPGQLTGEAIPLEARIIAVADAFDALTSARAHREELTSEAALEILRQSAGQQFDPAVVDAALRLKSRLPAPGAADDDEIGTALHRALQLLHS